ncbi:conserved hypothetical protein [Theileria orientalis strain Shintoku]|uniref:Uncharacterized protein n=1 Tax=Theileria orientalis strain Shintoku TaxID=869250 RepID=J4C3C9_THEOR|nr:conserved hypothetical protein [Theileria orientalis strain Shintoku]PVC51647.1 hypothetical protein MACL_00001465 [Theileria orientalis]BAM40221.1 conserved hypothetical protein [Theileria orientalis strain Shintoku]|eukprot:XP_009690522.1 conserved hypothetical protein [Theileria orientalis strain Shintoku]
MYSLFHKLLIKSEGTLANRPLLEYYTLLSNYYSFLRSTLGSVNYLVNNGAVYDSVDLGGNNLRSNHCVDRVPTLNVVREIEDLLKYHGFLNAEDDETYDNRNNTDEFTFDFTKNMKDYDMLERGLSSCDGDTTLITDENFSDISLTELDEFITFMENCNLEQ